MENTEIMEVMNEGVVDVVEDIVPTNSGLGWKVLGVAGLVAGIAWGATKLVKKYKAKKAEVADCPFNDENCYEVDEVQASEEE